MKFKVGDLAKLSRDGWDAVQCYVRTTWADDAPQSYDGWLARKVNYLPVGMVAVCTGNYKRSSWQKEDYVELFINKRLVWALESMLESRV
tara:strand:+ start:172 stop:441 length:270 start_codon:yes stop_codon:yes gene_type:complete